METSAINEFLSQLPNGLATSVEQLSQELDQADHSNLLNFVCNGAGCNSGVG